MPGLAETTSSSIRRLAFLRRILNTNNTLPPYCVSRKEYYSTKKDDNNSEEHQKSSAYVRIGNTIKEIKIAKCPEKVPRGYLSLYKGVTTDSQTYLTYLRWLMQKDELKQDSFLLGAPGAFRRNLAMSFAEMTQREVEYLCLTRDTTESDIKQRREIINSSVIYANQCAVNAALNGRILIIEGIEKAERNLLPILNNLLENREINLDDGHFLVAPSRYDKLMSIASEKEGDNGAQNLSDFNLLRVHEDFRVIAIGLPVPKYKGNTLDPPLRSRFQAHLVRMPDYADFLSYLEVLANDRVVDKAVLKNMCDFAYSFYEPEIASLNLIDFPIENLDKLARIMSKTKPANDFNESCDSSGLLNTSKLLNKLYPYDLVLKEDESNLKFLNDMLKKFSLPELKEVEKQTQKQNQIDYKLLSVIDNNQSNESKTVRFKSLYSNQDLEINVLKGSSNKKSLIESSNKFIMNEYNSSVLVDMFLNHASEHDFCLIGAQGCGKTELINKFAQLLDYNVHTLYLYKDMSARELIQQRVTLSNGNTKWQDSPLIEGAINGDLVILGNCFTFACFQLIH
jgi:hypothetical protein